MVLLPALAFGQGVYPRDRAAYEARGPHAIADDAAFFALLDRTRPDLNAVVAPAERGEFAAARRAWAAHLRQRTSPRWTYSRDDGPALGEALDRVGAKQRLVATADAALALRLNLNGTEVSLRSLDWADPRDANGNALGGSSRQVLNHLHQWTLLGRAGLVTGDPRYARAVADQVAGWAAANPVAEKKWMFAKDRADDALKWYQSAPGFDRYRSLCVGIRTPNLAESLELLVAAEEVDADAVFVLSRALAEHCRYLTTLGKVDGFRRAGNWQVIEAVGLASGAMMLPELAESKQWLETGLGLLGESLATDTRDDGWQSEFTPMYHGWVLAQYTQVLRLARVNGVGLSWDLGRLERMYAVYEKLAGPDGSIPGLGDARAGHARSPATAGALLYDRGELKSLGAELPDERAVFLFGPTAMTRYAGLVPTPPSAGSHLFADAGYAVLRTGRQPDDLWALFDAAPWAGGHSHGDALQVLMQAGPRPLLIDPGQTDYADPRSNELRKAERHNVVVTGESYPARPAPRRLGFRTTDAADFTAAELTGDGFSHRRLVLMVRPVSGRGPAWDRHAYLLVVDRVSTPQESAATRYFQLPPGADPVVEGSVVRTRFVDGPGVAIFLPAGEAATLVSREIPTGPRSFAPAAQLQLRHAATGGRTLYALMVPFSAANALPAVTPLPDNGTALRLRIEFPSGQTDILTIDPAAATASVVRAGMVTSSTDLTLP